MKRNNSSYPIVLAITLLGGNLHCLAVQFTNLNFDAAAATTGSAHVGDYLPASVAIPGWTALIEETPSPVIFNTITTGSSAIVLTKFGSLFSPSPLSGQFSVVLISGFTGVATPQPTSASISQTGLVPGTASSLRFIAQGDEPQVLASGTSLPVFLLGTTPNYNLYGTDISPFAGTEIELKFHRPHTANFTGFTLDDITFSTEPVPEPSVIALLSLAGAVSFWHLRRRF